MANITHKILGMKLEQYVSFSIMIVIVYTIAEFISGCFGMSHEVLTGFVYGFFGGEIVSCALIKIWKLKKDSFTSD